MSTLGNGETGSESPGRRRARRWGLVGAPILALAVYGLLPDSYSGAGGEVQSLGHAAKLTAALAVWMAVWWMTEAIPVYATALLPLAVLPAGGAASMGTTASAYAHELIFLFMGGFLLALGMERWGLHRRIALTAMRAAGTRPRVVIGAFMAVTAVMSMWVSNTATALMMMPIALSVVDLLGNSGEESAEPTEERRFALCLMLGIAYAASIGGLGTIIGSPPNVFVVSYIKSELGREVSFLTWMLIGVPLVCVFLPITWLLLTFVLYPVRLRTLPGGEAYFRNAFERLGKTKPGEWAVFLVFMATALCWMTRPLLAKLRVGDIEPFAGLTDAGIAMIAALLLFVIPADRQARTAVLDWEWAVKIPWGILILFGGGLSLAAAIDSTGVSAYLGSRVAGLRGLPPLALVVLVSALVIFLTELTSNTATTAAFVPILAAVAPGLGVPVVALIVPAALAASCAFMLPVATPPNAIVFGTGRVTIVQMARAGIWLNLVGIGLLVATAFTLILPLLG